MIVLSPFQIIALLAATSICQRRQHCQLYRLHINHVIGRTTMPLTATEIDEILAALAQTAREDIARVWEVATALASPGSAAQRG